MNGLLVGLPLSESVCFHSLRALEARIGFWKTLRGLIGVCVTTFRELNLFELGVVIVSSSIAL